MRETVVAGIVGSALLLAGCASGPSKVTSDDARAGRVGMRDISHVAAGERLVLADNETFLVPLENDSNPLPVYPEALLSRRLPPQSLCLRVSIDEQGAVMAAVPFEQLPDCAETGSVDVSFYEVAIRSVEQWRYEPALRCVFPDAKIKEATYGSCGGYAEAPQAISLTYRFMFEQEDGRGKVRISH